jgi:hypothetical protein
MMLMCDIVAHHSLEEASFVAAAAENMQKQHLGGVDTPAPALRCMSAHSSSVCSI